MSGVIQNKLIFIPDQPIFVFPVQISAHKMYIINTAYSNLLSKVFPLKLESLSVCMHIV